STGVFLFTRLENQFYGTRPILLCFMEYPCRTKQAGSMHIMAAGVHDAIVFGTVTGIIFFVNRECIHVSSQGNDTITRLTAPDQTDYSGIRFYFTGDTKFFEMGFYKT